MRILEGEEAKSGEGFMNEAAVIARQATCLRRRCGAVITKGGKVIGTGFNSPPRGESSGERCQYDKTRYHSKVTDKTCCMHAEVRAILSALRQHPETVEGATLFFVSIDPNNQVLFSGKPYCTICSKLALDVGLAEFVLWHTSGMTAYDTVEYHELSYNYTEDTEGEG